MKKHLWISLVGLLIGLTALYAPSARAEAPPKVLTRFVSESGVSLEQLAAGATGQGVILYYLSNKSWEQPAVVVRLSKSSGSSAALAQVYPAVLNLNYVPIKVEDNKVIIDPLSANPTIVINGLDGWWVKDGKTSYNLDVQINGQMYAMWGAAYDPQKGFTGSASDIKNRESAVSIQVRDPQHEGLPQWDWRTLVPAFSGRSYIRTNYAERKCPTALPPEPSVSPLWPYVGDENGYEQSNTRLKPPIGVNWSQGRIIYFSELVSVRNQNCSYSFYSLDPLLPSARLNRVNFEAPFGFYDLSGQGQGYPDLIIRTERYPANDPWTLGLADPDILKPFLQEVSWLRYSWRNAVGDGQMDQKVDVLGRNPYNSTTTIAGGSIKVDTPAYQEMPGWVVSHSWPVAVFVDTEGSKYDSSEGIYDWSARDVGIDYVLGWNAQPKLDQFATIRNGLRGEYRVHQNLPPKLYLSPIDDRLHLLAAEGGLWNLGAGQLLRLHNLNDSSYVNGWTLETTPSALINTSSVVKESLYALGGFLIYGGPSGVELRRTDYTLSQFETLPPSDGASWQTLRNKVASIADTKPNPKDLLSWLSRFKGDSLKLAGVQMTGVRAVGSDGFRLELTIKPGFEATDHTNLFNPAKLQSGRYALTYTNHTFSIEPLTSAEVLVKLKPTELTRLEQNALPMVLSNRGSEDATGVTLELWANRPGLEASLVASRTLTVLGGQQTSLNLQWAPGQAGNWTLTPRLRYADGDLVVSQPLGVQVRARNDPNPTSVIAASTPTQNILLVVVGLVMVGLAAALVFGWQWRRAIIEEGKSAD